MTRTAAVVCAICMFAGMGLRQALAFDYFEHRYLGNEAYKDARKELDPAFSKTLDKAMKTLGLGRKPDTSELADELLKKLPMEFGDLSALAGDFTEDVGELKALMLRIEKADWPGGIFYWLRLRKLQAEGTVVATRRHWYSACRWLYRSRPAQSIGTGSDWEKCFEKLPRSFDWDANFPDRLGSDGYRATREELAESEMISKYVSLASKNRDHFPRYSWKNYTRFHLRALRLAQCYLENKEEGCVDVEAALTGDPKLPELRALQLAQCYPEKEKGECVDVRVGVLPWPKVTQPVEEDKDPHSTCYHDVQRCLTKAHVSSKDNLLAQALLNEAFAQHYLQDSFASGHIGSMYGECSFLTCKPPKRVLEQTHDSLNELGLPVRIANPNSYVWKSQDHRSKLSEKGWPAFGDRHLLIPEADFHREVIVRTAARSIEEVFERAFGVEAFSRASGFDKEQPRENCHMCYTNVFPIPQRDHFLSKDSLKAAGKTDLADESYPIGDLVGFKESSFFGKFFGEQKSLDPRVPGIPVEGWKLGSGYANAKRPPFPPATGTMFKLDYIRNTDPIVPNSYGLEVWNLPDLRTSYQVSVGYSWPRQLSPVSFALKAKFGWRAENNFTTSNPTAKIQYGRELSVPSLEVIYEIYRPAALFLQLNPLTIANFQESGYAKERFNKGTWNGTVGLRFDFTGI